MRGMKKVCSHILATRAFLFSTKELSWPWLTHGDITTVEDITIGGESQMVVETASGLWVWKRLCWTSGYRVETSRNWHPFGFLNLQAVNNAYQWCMKCLGGASLHAMGLQEQHLAFRAASKLWGSGTIEEVVGKEEQGKRYKAFLISNTNEDEAWPFKVLRFLSTPPLGFF